MGRRVIGCRRPTKRAPTVGLARPGPAGAERTSRLANPGETPKRPSVTWISDPETRQPPLSWIQVARASTKQRRRSCRSNYAVSTKIDGSVDQSKLLSLSQGALLHREPSQ